MTAAPQSGWSGWSDEAARLLFDGLRYQADPKVASELGLSVDDIEDAAAGVRPLGMSTKEYQRFCGELFHALDREGIADADVRIQGSSVRFYAHAGKRMPFDEVAPHAVDRNLLWEAIVEGDRLPDKYICDKAEEELHQLWPTAARPARRPFDAFFRCAVHTAKSDYDVQISSDQMIDRVRQELSREGVDPLRITTTDERYAFVLKPYAENHFLYVTQWRERESKRLDRSVTWALFPSCGPQEVPGSDRSSHHQASDWIIHRPDPERVR